MSNTKAIPWIILAAFVALLIALYFPLSEPSPYDTDLKVPDVLGAMGDPW